MAGYWYRCRFVYNRGAIAADAAGHPRALGIKEEMILAELQDFNHPVVVAAAKQRIEEISSRQLGAQEAISNLKGTRPTGIRPDEIETMLQAIPDMRPTLQSADAVELAEICEAFRITVIYDKPNHTIELSATILPELLPKDQTRRTPKARRGIRIYSGGGFDP